MFKRWLKLMGGLGALLTALGIATSPFAQEPMPPGAATEAPAMGDCR